MEALSTLRVEHRPLLWRALAIHANQAADERRNAQSKGDCFDGSMTFESPRRL
jgi:hypothetical protein